MIDAPMKEEQSPEKSDYINEIEKKLELLELVNKEYC